jgi:exoribonuclease-2
MEDTYNLAFLAKQVMKSRGLKPDFSPEVLKEVEQIQQPAKLPEAITDLRKLNWCSIDNDDSRDLDQLTYAEKVGSSTVMWIAVADVSAITAKDSAIDQHAEINTTSVYTPAKVFPMLPEKLSTNLTSLNENEDRLSTVIKILVNQNGDVEESSILQAVVHNRAKLNYNEIGAWLRGEKSTPSKVKNLPGLEQTLKQQYEISKILKKRRHQSGALSLQTSEAIVKVFGDELFISQPTYNEGRQLIEEFMIAANVEMAKQLEKAKVSSLRRIVRVPKRWSRIVEVAKELGELLPDEPDALQLDAFLLKRKRIDPDSFHDLSLTVVKLLGRGEYVVQKYGEPSIGHFGLALKNYTHTTAPNRRFPDLITQRQYKAFLNQENPPYSLQELEILAEHCTKQEDAALKVERQTNKSAEALFLSSSVGKIYKGIITGASEKGTWVRISQPPIEGKVIMGFEHLDVGNKVTVQLVSVDVPRGFIDFRLV